MLNIKVKYFKGQDKKIQKIVKGDCIDLFANEDIFIPLGEMRLVPLGIAMELPNGYEAHLMPRSSTFKNWGCIQTNSFGLIDNTYCGDNDQWMLPLFCLNAKDEEEVEVPFHDITATHTIVGSWIRKGDKICQFRIMENMPDLEIIEVETLGNADRNGFGSTGKI